MIVRWPNVATAGTVRHELVSTLDIFPTLLSVTDAKVNSDLAGRSLLPLLRDEPTAWREYLFTEYQTHSAHNYYPQRTVRGPRYKLIQNLLPDEENPGYAFTLRKFFPELPATIDNARPEVRASYERMRAPPKFELYDLQNDPHEFHNLAEAEGFRDVRERLVSKLTTWQQETGDPMLLDANVRRLQDEIQACYAEGTYDKSRLRLNYPEYFFE